jgi:hypothetical protein
MPGETFLSALTPPSAALSLMGEGIGGERFLSYIRQSSIVRAISSGPETGLDNPENPAHLACCCIADSQLRNSGLTVGLKAQRPG